MSERTDPVLMTKENPEGWKLEDILAQMIREIDAKNTRISTDKSVGAETVRYNNMAAIEHLKLARQHQMHTLMVLDEIGPDQGPTGKPRIGEGS